MLQNMRAKNAVRLRVGHELNYSIEVIVRDRPGIGPERESPDAIIDPLLFRLLFS